MHDELEPHCIACEHFDTVFRVDLVVEWGRCRLKCKVSDDELSRLKRDADNGPHKDLIKRAAELGLIVPTFTDCPDFTNFFPI